MEAFKSLNILYIFLLTEYRLIDLESHFVVYVSF